MPSTTISTISTINTISLMLVFDACACLCIWRLLSRARLPHSPADNPAGTCSDPRFQELPFMVGAGQEFEQQFGQTFGRKGTNYGSSDAVGSQPDNQPLVE